MSYEQFMRFLDIPIALGTHVYQWLSQMQVGGISVFQWMVSLCAFGLLISIVHTFAAIGHISIGTVAGDRSAAVRKKQSESYEAYKSRRERAEGYRERYNSEKGGK